MTSSEPSQIRTFIETTLIDADNNAVLKKLEQLGVESMEDLKFLQESDLSSVLKPVQIRKLLHTIQLLGSIPSNSKVTTSNPACNTGQHFPLSQTQFEARKFSLESVLDRLPELHESLKNSNRLQADARRLFVREVVSQVRRISVNCSKKQFEEIAKSIVLKYPNTFEDRIDKIRIGTGYDSLLKQFVSRNENLNRSKSPQNKENSGESQQKTETEKRKVVHDSYGCINWGPSISIDEESEQENTREKLKSSYGLDPDWDKVYSGMEATYPLLRKHINSGESLRQLREDWPYLVDQNVLLAHCKELLGKDLLQAVENSFAKKAPRMLRFFKSRTPNVEPYIAAAEKEKQADNFTAILQLVIVCLQRSLNEKEDSLFVVVDEMSSNEEVENACSGKTWPRLAMLGPSILAAKDSILIVDGQVFGRFGSFLSALSLLFGIYYVLNIQYPNEAAATLEFIQRCFMGINPDAGLKTSKKKKTSAVNPKVLRLINELADFEWTDQN